MRKADIGFNAAAFATEVQREVSRLPGATIKNGATYFLCPYHSEKTPSAKVTHDAASPYLGRFFCWGCKKTASWQEFAEVAHLSPLNGKEFYGETAPSFASSFYEEHLLGQADEDAGEEEIDDDVMELPFNERNAAKLGLKDNEWRGFPIEFLADLDNIRFRKRWNKARTRSRWYLRLPVVVNGVERGYADAQLFKPDEGPSYLNKKGAWSKKFALFPFDYTMRLMQETKLRTLVLVEGQRDALRLLRYGIPALAITGTNSWSRFKIRLLELAGVKRVILCMDGDVAGELATESMIPTLENGFRLHVIRLWVIAKKMDKKKIDPGDMPTGLVRRLKKLVYKDQGD